MRAVNLVPGEQRRGSTQLVGRSGGAALIVLGLIVGVAVLAALYGVAAHQIAKQAGEVAKLEAQTSEVRARANRLTPYTSFVSMAEQRTKTVAQLVQARFDWSHTLRELGRVLPSGVSLQTLNGDVGSGVIGTGPTAASASTASSGGTPSSSTPPGSTPAIALSGCATSQSEVAQMLQRLKLIDGVQEAHLQSSTAASATASGSASGGCGTGHPVFAVTITFASLPSTPVPNVAPTTTAANTPAKGAHAEPVAAHLKGAQR